MILRSSPLGSDTAVAPYVADPDFSLHVGDVRDVLPRLEPDSVDCALTSPPFYALRDYGVDGQIGLEATPDEWAAELVAVFREVRRLLKPTGTLWVECGDSYGANVGNGFNTNAREGHRNSKAEVDLSTPITHPTKPKDLIGAPWLLAFALRADGWYLRQCIIWQKPNAMPESAKDRCTTAHSYVFLLAKQPRYWFDADAIAEPAEWARWGDQTVPKYEGTDTATGWMQQASKTDLQGRARGLTGGAYSPPGQTNHSGANGDASLGATKNARSVWSIPTAGFPEAHFATWPEALVERIVKAGCPEWVCRACGKPRERLTDGASYYRDRDTTKPEQKYATMGGGHGGVGRGPKSNLGASIAQTVGWSDCGCGAGFTPGVCLDPFMGSGTTALVARRLNRRSVGVELNEEYAEMAARRLGQLSLLAEPAA